MAPADSEETIVAPATGNSEAGVAVVRMSGGGALAVLSGIFRAKNDSAVADWASRCLVKGSVVRSDGEVVDDCLAVVMRAPYSFTGENVAEIQCHGGMAVIRAVLDCCLAAGARPADPGEFSRRAFANGKIDLSQAEALADLVAAQTELGRKLALRQLRGGLSGRIQGIREMLINASAEIEARLDFPEEDIPALTVGRISDDILRATNLIAQVLQTYERGRIVREGARVVLVGKPNAGKSSLFNALLGHERAIVSPHPGTTRDTIEATIDLQGLAVTLVDTAGMRDAADVVEQMGIERTNEEIHRADLILYIIDGAAESAADPDPDFDAAETASLTVWNKADVRPPVKGSADLVAVSATTREGMSELETALRDKLLGNLQPDEIEVVRARHAQCLTSALDACRKAGAAFAGGLSGEFVMVDLREALLSLGEITGERLDEEILDRVFNTFCLGK